MTPKILAAAFVASFGLMQAPASAEKVHFDYGAHELRTAGGAQALYKRLRREARQACEDRIPMPIAQKTSQRSCTAALTSEWVAEINDARVSRIHARAGGSIYVAGSN